MINSEYNYSAAEKLSVADQDRPELLKLADRIYRLSKMARENGLLALDSVIHELTEPMLKIGIRLVVDGREAETVKGILLTALYAGNYQGAELVKRMMITDGVLLLQEGLNPIDVRVYLSAYLGEDTAAAVMDNH